MLVYANHAKYDLETIPVVDEMGALVVELL
jgi:hypothetical protein